MATNAKGGSAARSSKAPAAAPAAPAPAPTSAPAPAQEQVQEQVVLLGSSTLPALIEIGGKEVQLGTIVAAAHAASGLSAADWNGLSEEDRDERLNAQVEAMQQQADAEAEEAESKRLSEAAVDAFSDQSPKFPRRVLVSNNAGLALVEPITGAYIQPGGKAHITLTDPDHAHRVAENLRAVLDQNYLPDSVLTVEDAGE